MYAGRYEEFTGSMTQIEQLQNDSKAGVLAAVHSEGDFNTTLAAFLLGAGDNAYYGATFQHGEGAAPGDKGWSEPAWDGVRPEYTRKLGAPLGPATMDAATGVLSRHFKSGTYVTLGPQQTMNSSDSADSLGFYTADINNVAAEIPSRGVHLAGKFASAFQCEYVCAKDRGCLSYTWCEQRERHHGIELGSAGHSRVGSMGGETPLPAS
eukprot:SAG22_NODE_1379_length_4547_cov_8.497752_6_plen_209_part_00